MKITCYDPKKKKTVLCGNVTGDTFTRIVTSKHFLQLVQGYGIQEVAFTECLEKGVKHFEMKEDKTGVIWTATAQTWIDHSKVMDFGNGKQRFLSLKYMNQKKETS